MNKFFCALSILFVRRHVCCRRCWAPSSYLLRTQRLYSTTGDALVNPKEGSTLANVDIVNYSLAGVYIVAFNEHGFWLSNGAIIYGSMVSFPQNAFTWNVTSAKDINEGSISLFKVLCPQLEVLIIGKGTTTEQIDQRKIMDMCWEHGLGVEILPTPSAIGSFNFLNAEGRYVAAALIPPIRLDMLEGDASRMKRLAAARDVRMEISDRPKLRELSTKNGPKTFKGLPNPTSDEGK